MFVKLDIVPRTDRSVKTGNIPFINATCFESNKLISLLSKNTYDLEYAQRKELSSNRYIEYTLVDDNNKTKNVMYSRRTIKVPVDFKEIHGLDSEFIYNKDNAIIYDKSISRIYTPEKISKMSSRSQKIWLTRLKMLDKAYKICFPDEQCIDDADDRIRVYKEELDKSNNKINSYMGRLRDAHEKRFNEQFSYGKLNLQNICMVKESRTIDTLNNGKVPIVMHRLQNEFLNEFNKMLTTDFEMGIGLILIDKNTGTYYSIWTVGKTYRFEEEMWKHSKIICMKPDEKVFDSELSKIGVVYGSKKVVIIEPSVLILEHSDVDNIQSMDTIVSHEVYNYRKLKTLPDKFVHPFLKLLSAIHNPSDELYTYKDILKNHMIYDFGFKDIVQALNVYNKKEVNGIRSIETCTKIELIEKLLKSTLLV